MTPRRRGATAEREKDALNGKKKMKRYPDDPEPRDLWAC